MTFHRRIGNMTRAVICLPTPDPDILARRDEILRALRALVPAANVIEEPLRLAAYETDALTAYRQRPLVVVLPETTAQVAALLAFAHREGVNVVPRGAGTSLSGGAIPAADAIVIALGKFNRILDIDYANRCVVAQCGVTNLAISHAVAAEGFYYAPDPSSQIACTIGGNVAENSGGVHCLKYGLTTNNVLGVELVTPDGEVVRLGGRHLDAGHYDLLGLTVGSEGLLGIVTEVTVRILRRPQVARALLIGFGAVEPAAACVASVIAAGIIPAGMEMMDRPAIHAAEAFVNVGYPLDVEALLIVELDGTQTEVDYLIERVSAIAAAHGAASVRASANEAERLKFWAGRKAAFPAVGRLSPDYYCMDGTIPRRELPRVLTAIAEMSQRYGLRVANVFHAGDGNLHPLVLYDARIAGQEDRAERLAFSILELCVKAGGSITGEHGVGEEKKAFMPVMFAEPDLDTMQRVRCAFDPERLSNPTKVFPRPRLCAEKTGPYQPHPLETAGVAQLF
jgi:glycolate dehydrogenase FAD-linked subunit